LRARDGRARVEQRQPAEVRRQRLITALLRDLANH
jgi:hypothetical protein